MLFLPVLCKLQNQFGYAWSAGCRSAEFEAPNRIVYLALLVALQNPNLSFHNYNTIFFPPSAQRGDVWFHNGHNLTYHVESQQGLLWGVVAT